MKVKNAVFVAIAVPLLASATYKGLAQEFVKNQINLEKWNFSQNNLNLDLNNLDVLKYEDGNNHKIMLPVLPDGFKLKFLSEEELTDLLLRFVRMSDKKHQQNTINEIKNILMKIEPKGFE